MTQRAHSHWVTSAMYNRFHYQLVLSASTDVIPHPNPRPNLRPNPRTEPATETPSAKQSTSM